MPGTPLKRIGPPANPAYEASVEENTHSLKPRPGEKPAKKFGNGYGDSNKAPQSWKHSADPAPSKNR